MTLHEWNQPLQIARRKLRLHRASRPQDKLHRGQIALAENHRSRVREVLPPQFQSRGDAFEGVHRHFHGRKTSRPSPQFGRAVFQRSRFHQRQHDALFRSAA